MRLHRIRTATAALALICFCLPWIEIRCNHPDHGLIVTSQSGLQMTFGNSITTVNGKLATQSERTQAAQKTGKRESPVPLMIICGASLVAALAFSLLVANHGRRWLLATAASGAAATALVVQLALGFPLVEGVPRGNGGWHYTPWFWIALASTCGLFLVSLGEKLVSPIPVGLLSGVTRQSARRIITGAGLVGVLAVSTFAVLFVWPGYLRPLPHHGVSLSGELDYILSQAHIDAIQTGMTFDELQATLDVAQAHRPLDPWIKNVSEAQELQRRTGQDNVRTFESAKQGLLESGEVWFGLSGPGHHAVNLRLRNGKVVEKVVHSNELQTEREQSR